jgi:hypothetical protein
MVLPSRSGPWPHIQIRNHFSQTVWLLGQVISSSQGRYLNTGQHKQNKRIHTPNIHALSGIWTHDPSVRASEDSSCLRPRGYCDRLASVRAKTVHALDRAATVIGSCSIQPSPQKGRRSRGRPQLSFRNLRTYLEDGTDHTLPNPWRWWCWWWWLWRRRRRWWNMSRKFNKTSYKMGTGGSFPGVKRQGSEADRSPPTSAEVKKTWIYTPTPPYVFRA